VPVSGPDQPSAEPLVARVRCRGVDVRAQAAVHTAGGTMASTPLALIDVETDDGHTGRAYLRAYTPVALAALVTLVGDAGRSLIGRCAAPAAAEEHLRQTFRLVGTRGLTGMAIAGLDMALWDARARRAGLALAELLGGRPGPVAAYATIRAMGAEAAAREAAALAELGLGAVKVKLGGGSEGDDVAVVGAIRRAVGPDVGILADFNQSLTAAGAAGRLRRLDDLGLAWIEEPLAAEDDRGHAELAGRLRTPVALGENWWDAADLRRSLDAGACRQAIFDAARIGGVSGWLRAAEVARQRGAPVSSHTFQEVSAQLLRVTPTARWLEYLDHAAPILAEPLAISSGMVAAARGPGTGIAWDEDAVARWRVC
jgi:mandelate racemase